MKIFIGPAGTPKKATSVPEGIRVVREIGLNSMEVEFTYGVRMSEKTAREARNVSEENKVRLSVHAPYYINLCNPEKLDASMKRILDSCEKADIMGAHIVVFHAGFYTKLSKEEAYKRIRNACKDMSSEIKKNGWNATLGIETTGKQSQFGTIEEVIRLNQEIEKCVPVIDWAHLYARNGGMISYKGIIECLSELDIDVHHTHFSGIEYTEKGERRHLPISSNQPPFDKLADEILKNKLDINIICESPELEDDALKMKKIFAKKGYILK